MMIRTLIHSELDILLPLKLNSVIESSKYDKTLIVSEIKASTIKSQLSDELSMPNIQYLGVFIENQLIGYLLLNRDMTTNSYFIGELYVVPERRNQGVGTKLIKNALQTAKNNKARYADLTVASKNRDATRLYQKLGFKNKHRIYKLMTFKLT